MQCCGEFGFILHTALLPDLLQGKELDYVSRTMYFTESCFILKQYFSSMLETWTIPLICWESVPTYCKCIMHVFVRMQSSVGDYGMLYRRPHSCVFKFKTLLDVGLPLFPFMKLHYNWAWSSCQTSKLLL